MALLLLVGDQRGLSEGAHRLRICIAPSVRVHAEVLAHASEVLCRGRIQTAVVAVGSVSPKIVHIFHGWLERAFVKAEIKVGLSCIGPLRVRNSAADLIWIS